MGKRKNILIIITTTITKVVVVLVVVVVVTTTTIITTTTKINFYEISGSATRNNLIFVSPYTIGYYYCHFT